MYLVYIRFSMRTRFEKCIFPRFDLFWYININLRLLCTCKCKHRSFKIKIWIESFVFHLYSMKKIVLIAIEKYGIRFDIRIFKALSFNIFLYFSGMMAYKTQDFHFLSPCKWHQYFIYVCGSFFLMTISQPFHQHGGEKQDLCHWYPYFVNKII